MRQESRDRFNALYLHLPIVPRVTANDTRLEADPTQRPVRIVGAIAAIAAVSVIGGVYTVAEAVDRVRARRLAPAHRGDARPRHLRLHRAGTATRHDRGADRVAA